MPSISGQATTEGNTARKVTSPANPARRACHCRCRRRAQPEEECEEVFGSFFFFLFAFSSLPLWQWESTWPAGHGTLVRSELVIRDVHEHVQLLYDLLLLLLLLLPSGLQHSRREEAEGGGVHHFGRPICQARQRQGRRSIIIRAESLKTQNEPVQRLFKRLRPRPRRQWRRCPWARVRLAPCLLPASSLLLSQLGVIRLHLVRAVVELFRESHLHCRSHLPLSCT